MKTNGQAEEMKTDNGQAEEMKMNSAAAPLYLLKG